MARKTLNAEKCHLSDILTIFGVFWKWHFFHFFDFDFSLFDDFWFCRFLIFVTFSLFHFFLFLSFIDFWSIFVIFCVWDDFWSIIVSKLSAPMMTHFSPSIPALPLSPVLVVKFHHILTLHFDVNFWSFLVNFCLNWVENDEKLDFAIKNHCFWVFFWSNFSQILIIFDTFFDPFWGFLGGYPSPSISAPLVVKKCLKLYIYI